MSYRPQICEICHLPIPQAKTGRPRKTCSDRCRQIKRRRYDYNKWRDPRAADQAHRAAERKLRAIEREVGPIENTPPIRRDIHTSTLSVRQRLTIRMAMGQEVPTCRYCFKPYIREEGTPRFCSTACQKAFLEHERAVYQAIARHQGALDPRLGVRLRMGLPIQLCKHCGKPFPPYNIRRKFCSDACRKQHWREEKRRRTKRCPVCGAHFPGTKNSQVYCSKQCRDRANYEKKQAKHPDPPKHRLCPVCGTGFVISGQAKGRRNYCSDECRNRAKYLSRRARTVL